MKATNVLMLTCALALAACGGSIRFTSLDGDLPPDMTEPETGVESDTGEEPDDDDVFVLPADDAAREDDAAPDACPDSNADAAARVDSSDGMSDARADATSTPDASSDANLADVRDAGTAASDTGVRADATTLDAGEAASDAATACRSAAECADSLTDTRDWCDNGVCRHDRCDDNNTCTDNVATATGCTFPALPNGTPCRPGAPAFTCMSGVCPSCGGENEACCEWPGSTAVCRGAALCRTTATGLRRCITCGGAGERCCNSADGIVWASQRCNAGLSCSSIPGVAGTCR